MAKGILKQYRETTFICQYCGQEKTYTQTTTAKRKVCLECVPLDKRGDASHLRRIIKKKMVEEAGGLCQRCHQAFPDCVFDFHHRDESEKSFSLGDKTSTVKLDLIRAEVEKCDLLCSNCHRIVHDEQRK